VENSRVRSLKCGEFGIDDREWVGTTSLREGAVEHNNSHSRLTWCQYVPQRG
jgi:hypothetical protein